MLVLLPACPCLCGSAASYFAPVPTPTTRRWSLAWLALATAPAESRFCIILVNNSDSLNINYGVK